MSLEWMPSSPSSAFQAAGTFTLAADEERVRYYEYAGNWTRLRVPAQVAQVESNGYTVLVRFVGCFVLSGGRNVVPEDRYGTHVGDVEVFTQQVYAYVADADLRFSRSRAAEPD